MTGTLANYITEYLNEMKQENEKLLIEFPFFWLPPFQEKYTNVNHLTYKDFGDIIDKSNELTEKIKQYVSVDDFLAFDTRFGGEYKEYSLGILFRNEDDKLTAMLACG